MFCFNSSARIFRNVLICIGCFSIFGGAFALCTFFSKNLATDNLHRVKTPYEAFFIEESAMAGLVPAQFPKAVAEYSKQDIGLKYYRNHATQNYVIWFYSHITQDREIAKIILENADKNDVPVSLAFALAYKESRYRPQAKNDNKDSIDRGLFQLNNKSFPDLTEDDFFNPRINAATGLSYFKKCLDMNNGREVGALAMYNAGMNKVRRNNTPYCTLDYISAITDYRDGLDKLFEQEVINKKQNEETHSDSYALSVNYYN